MERRAFLRWAAAAAAAAVGRPGWAAARGRWWSSLVFGVFENQGFAQVAGLPSHRRLAREGTVHARYSGVAHPSGPNYRAMVSGATWGTEQTVETFHHSVGSEAAKRVPPIPTYVYHLVGEIPPKHNPFADLRAPVASVRHGLAAFRSDLAGALPSSALVYVGWDDDNNLHDGSPDVDERGGWQRACGLVGAWGASGQGVADPLHALQPLPDDRGQLGASRARERGRGGPDHRPVAVSPGPSGPIRYFLKAA